jgi:hypothetical protein
MGFARRRESTVTLRAEDAMTAMLQEIVQRIARLQRMNDRIRKLEAE